MTRLTNPMRRASSAIISPVSNISIACLRETLRDHATIGVEQKSPLLTPGVAKRADDDETARSQVATSWQQAAVAMPWPWAITGFFFNATATTEIYTLSLHDALPI